jgi:hypothetical protein
MLMKTFMTLIVLLSLSGRCWADGWTPELTVTSAFTEDSDIIVVYTSDGGTYAPGCSANSWIFSITASDARRSRVWATLLTAIATGQKLSFWYTNACATWSYHNFTSIKIIK